MMKAPEIFNNQQICRNRDRAAARFGEADFLKMVAIDRLEDRLGLIRRSFDNVMDIGAHGGYAARYLSGHEKIGQITSFDPSFEFVKQGGAWGQSHQMMVESLPDDLPPCDAVISLLYLHQVNDLPRLMRQMASYLKPDGLFFAILCGGRTLQELRASLAAAEEEITGGISAHVAPMADIKDVGGLLQHASLAMPVADSEVITVTYSSIFKLMQDLRLMGEGNALKGRLNHLSRRDVFFRAAEIYQERYGLEDGQIPASFELISLTGWKPDQSQPKPLRPGAATSSITDIF